ncbi:MAG: pilus assembly protein [Planctomycetes bacterium]|nr:pilus assembly protein [Planctomycetota bacterium]
MKWSHKKTAVLPAKRRGAATVEFALMMPLFVTLTMATIQTGIQITAAQTLTSALREGGRIASMDYKSRLQSGQSINQKVINDIQNFLTAEKIDGTKVTITITAADGASAGTAFDISDPANQLKMFKIHAVVPYSAISSVTFFPHTNNTISASIVYRMGKNTMVQ